MGEKAWMILRDRTAIGGPGAVVGAAVYPCKGWDYGCVNDDTRHTGIEHTSVTLDPGGDYPFFTIPKRDLAPAGHDPSTEGAGGLKQAEPEGLSVTINRSPLSKTGRRRGGGDEKCFGSVAAEAAPAWFCPSPPTVGRGALQGARMSAARDIFALGPATERLIEKAFSESALAKPEPVAAILGVDERTLRRMAASGVIRSVIVGASTRRYTEADLRAYLAGERGEAVCQSTSRRRAATGGTTSNSKVTDIQDLLALRRKARRRRSRPQNA